MRNILLFLLLIHILFHKSELSQAQEALNVHYNNYRIKLDGSINEWPSAASNYFSTIGYADTNHCRLGLLWDEDFLYVSVFDKDKYLVAPESTGDPHRLHLNDGFELYIDPLNDSRNQFDINDIQFIFDVLGGEALFRGDRLNAEEKHKVPKDERVARIVYHAVLMPLGSLNDNGDNDEGYVVEVRIPWAGMGVRPFLGMQLKADFCINDNDTLLDMRTVPEGPVHNYSSTSYLGFSDYGFPQNWPGLMLVGSPGLLRKVEVFIAGNWVLLLSLLIFSILGSLAATYLLLSTLRKIPKREEQKDEPLVRYVTTIPEQEAKDRPKIHPYIGKVRELVHLNPDSPFRTEDLAAMLATSERQLQRVFQNEFDTSPKVFVITVKLELASQMLADGNKNVSEVAYALGFSDPSYFSKVFRKYYGLSPSEYQAERARR